MRWRLGRELVEQHEVEEEERIKLEEIQGVEKQVGVELAEKKAEQADVIEKMPILCAPPRHADVHLVSKYSLSIIYSKCEIGHNRMRETFCITAIKLILKLDNHFFQV